MTEKPASASVYRLTNYAIALPPWLLRYGYNLEYIRLMLGHSDIRTASRAYLHVANADLAEASKRSSPVVNHKPG